MADRHLIRDVLDFWFLPLDDPGHAGRREIWWQSTPEFDAEIAQRFGDAVERATAGAFDSWRRSPDGALALIVLTDQFPRNMHRRTARAFAGDAKALETARFALSHGYPAAYPVAMRQFFFMPFEHSERLADQELCCALIAACDTPESLQHAIDHRDVVARFGRFPHRNEALGRPCTDEELAYLTDAKRYGQ
ncbi:MAG: DUF924 family protein [Reyranellaceae bacterium]